MNPLAIAISIVIVVIALLMVGSAPTWFTGEQVRLAYIGITIFAGFTLVGAFKGA